MPDEIVDSVAVPARRAPYSDNPTVGARGLRTQQRILDAALEVFGEYGYDRSTFDRIASRAGCSRVSIYQYFAGKDDLFRRLAGQVVRQVRAATEALDPVTPDKAGVEALHRWISRCAAVHEKYEPVFRAFNAAAATDAALVEGAEAASDRHLGVFLARVSEISLPPRQFEPMVMLLLRGLDGALDIVALLRATSPGSYDDVRLERGMAEAAHRVLFGCLAGVNDGCVAGAAFPSLEMSAELRGMFERVNAIRRESTDDGRRALASMLDAGSEVVRQRGHLGVRVNDVIEAADVSHGAFYRYFSNVEEFVTIVSIGAVAEMSESIAAPPDGHDRASLRRWLRSYQAVHATHGALIRIWTEAAEVPARDDCAAVFDWGRRRMIRLLGDRGFGDAEVDGLMLLAMVEAFGAQARDAIDVDAAGRVVERGFVDGVFDNALVDSK